MCPTLHDITVCLVLFFAPVPVSLILDVSAVLLLDPFGRLPKLTRLLKTRTQKEKERERERDLDHATC